ncbi:MAG UNVERIFIED_CONTAM: hypothetical protein LVR29_04945 [Microcystis novacekii LVE1205-3]
MNGKSFYGTVKVNVTVEKPNPMNRREFVALVGVGGDHGLRPEILGTATDQEMTPTKRRNGFVKVTGITLKELEAKGSFLDKKSPVGSLLLIWEKKTEKNQCSKPDLYP